MTATQVRKYIFETVKKVFSNAGITDGTTLDQDEVAKTKKTLYWNNRIKSNHPGIKKDTFIIWTLIDTNAVGYADNQVARRKTYVALDIYTRKNDTDQATQSLLEKLEKAFLNEGWTFELEGPTSEDSLTGHNQIQYAVSIKK